MQSFLLCNVPIGNALERVYTLQNLSLREEFTPLKCKTLIIYSMSSIHTDPRGSV